MSAVSWSAKGSKTNPVGADELLILDSADPTLATKNKRVTATNFISLFQTPILQNVDGNGKNLSNLNDLTAISATLEDITISKTVAPIITTKNSSTSPTATLFRLDAKGVDDVLYSRVQSVVQSNILGDESARMLFSVIRNGAILNGVELDGLNQQFMLLNGVTLHMGNSAITNAGTLNTHTIPGGTDTLALLSDVGEANTASNVGDDGLGVFKQKTGVDFEFKKLTGAIDGKVLVTHNFAETEIIFDIDESQFTTVEKLANKNQLGGYPGLDLNDKIQGNHIIYGTISNSAAQGNDSRLSDDRTPLAHATSHKLSGTDSIKLDELATPDDNTNLDATTSLHGLFSKADKTKLDNIETEFTWAVTDEDSPLPPNGTELYTTEPATKDRIITKITAGLKNAPTGSNVTIGINKETGVNTNVFEPSGVVTIEVNHFVSKEATVTFVILNPNWDEGTRLRITLAGGDTNNAASGLKVTYVA